MKYTVLFSAIFFLAACKKNTSSADNPKPAAPADVYVAGIEFDASRTKTTAKYWKNGVGVNLTNGDYYAVANSITVAGNDVYVAGFQTNPAGINVAKYWKNGTPVNLSQGVYSAYANSIAVSGTDVYTAGYENNASGIPVAKYWKNGTEILLANGTTWSGAKAIAISGTDVYVAGYENTPSGKGIAKFWKNGTGVNLTNGDVSATTTSIFIKGTDVYVAGVVAAAFTNEKLMLWKNGVPQVLSDSSHRIFAGNVMAFIGNDVLIPVYSNTNPSGTWAAAYWRNNVAFGLTSGTAMSFATSIGTSGSDIYIGGYLENATVGTVPVYWKNGQVNNLSTNGGYTYSIFVK